MAPDPQPVAGRLPTARLGDTIEIEIASAGTFGVVGGPIARCIPADPRRYQPKQLHSPRSTRLPVRW